MSEHKTVYEKAITTDRPAELLARKHGFEGLAQLAKFLTPGAQVIDVGAGASPFGREVAVLRPDIAWINFDYSYEDPAILKDVSKGAPPNLMHIFGDATKLAEVYAPDTFDAVFSYWLLPHLSIDDPAPAIETAKAIFHVTKTGGLMSVGPKASRNSLPSPKSGRAIQVIKGLESDKESYAEQIVLDTKLNKAVRYTQKLANEVATPFFGTTRYAKSEGRVPKLYHPLSGEYVSPFSPIGVRTAGRLVIAMARHALSQSKTKCPLSIYLVVMNK